MKRVFSFVIVLAVMMSLCVSAFAAGSPIVGPSTGKGDDVISVVDPDNPDAEISSIPAKALKTVAINQADKKLSEEDAKAFKAAYEEAMAKDDCKVYKCFWLYVDEELAGEGFKGVSKDCALAYKFTCPGKDVKLYVNGNEMKVINEKGQNYIAFLTETGTVTITCAK